MQSIICLWLLFWRRQHCRSLPALMPLKFPQFLQRHGFDVAVVKGYIDGASVAIGAEAAHAGVVTAVVGSGGGAIFHRPSIYPDAVSKHRRSGRITFLRGDIKHIPVPVIGAIHVWMIPAVEAIAPRNAAAAVHPDRPTARITADHRSRQQQPSDSHAGGRRRAQSPPDQL